MTSVLIKIYLKLCSVIPGFRKISRKLMYQAMGRFIKEENWTYMNYGYAPVHTSDTMPELEPSDEVNRLSYQLYNHLAAEINLKNLKVLEIGSGRGGGASMVKKYHNPETITGVDFSTSAVKRCNRNNKSDGIAFVVGDAENLPFNNDSFDAVINVESSHCYESMNRFLGEVKKVLKPGGYFLFTDFREPHELEPLESLITNTGMKVLKKRDITPNVIRALDEDHSRRMKLISDHIPKPFIKQFREFAGVKDSVVYKQFEKGLLIYFSYVLQKQI